MKFAVKTVTCLGCRTPLKPNSLSQSLTSFATRSLADPVSTRRPSRLQQLPPSNGRVARQASLHCRTSRNGLRSSVDAVPTLPGLAASGALATTLLAKEQG